MQFLGQYSVEPDSHYSYYMSQFGLKPWSIWTLLKRYPCHTGFLIRVPLMRPLIETNENEQICKTDWTLSFLSRLRGFLWETQDQHCFQLSAPFILEYWLRIILPLLANGRRGVPVVHRENTDCWEGSRNRSTDLFHTLFLSLSLNCICCEGSLNIFPFFLCPAIHATSLNNSYGLDARIWLKGSMASVMEEGGQAGTLWTPCKTSNSLKSMDKMIM